MKSKPKPLIDNDGEAREWTEDDFKKATRGRPPMPENQKKERITMYLDRDVLAHFKQDGAGWQTRINDALRSLTK